MFRQEFEMETDCKKVKTVFNRFKKKYPAAWEIWGETLEYMGENNIEHIEEKNNYSLWVYSDEDFGTHYIAIILLDECQKIE